ncbi:SIMPL domain-containing protein [Helicovermis profundi]|uniref:SIMPL domain-containing protein n=1 Tax=Helicovermis profundi TaxID=3065157 RepID=A0AAU9E558_9FIRM|nr:hypothetical protein HLPR_15060 [Clostridia bacterium S502]
MKKLIIGSIVGIVAVALMFGGGYIKGTSTSSADEITKTSANKVSVTGSGTISMKPDVAYVNVGVTTQNEVAALAQEENKKLMNAVMDSLLDMGLLKENLTTSNYSLYKTTLYNKEEKEDVVIANNTLKVKLTDLDMVGKVIDVAAKNGANKINSVRFEVADTTKAYNDALVLAMKSAESKAKAIMGTFDESPIKPSSVTESSYGGRMYNENVYADFSAKALSASTPINAENIDVTANVTVEYQY